MCNSTPKQATQQTMPIAWTQKNSMNSATWMLNSGMIEVALFLGQVS